MKIRFLSLILIFSLALSLSGCAATADRTASADTAKADTVIRFNGVQVSITGTGASLDEGDVVIAEPGVYEVSGICDRSRVIVKAAEDADVTIVLAGLTLTNPEDEAVYFKTCGSAAVVLKEGTENVLISGEAPLSEAEQELTITDEGEEPTGAALRSRCAMTISGEGTLTVRGYINNGIAADGGLTIESGVFDVTAVNDAIKSDADVTILGGSFTVDADHDGIAAGLALDISGGVFDVTTGAASSGAEMKISDSSMMGDMGGGMGGERNNRSSSEASTEASTEAAETIDAAETADGETETAEPASAEPAAEATAQAGGRNRNNGGSTEMMALFETIQSRLSTEDITAILEAMQSGDSADMTALLETVQSSLSEEEIAAILETVQTLLGEEDIASILEMIQSGDLSGLMGMMGGFDDMMDSYDADNLTSDSYKGLKAGESITITGGVFALDCQDDAIHSDGTVTITGGSLLILSGDDGIRGETELVISGGEIDVQYCYEGLEATSILITGGYTSIVATDDGMNAGGGMMGMMGGMGNMGGPSREASTEAATEDATSPDAASGEIETTAESEASGEAEATAESTSPIVRITGGTVIIDSGGDGLDSNGNMYIEGGIIFVSGPSTNWDSPVDYGDGNCEFVITGGTLMAAGYSGMFEAPDTLDSSQASIYYIQSDYASDNAVTTLTAADGTVLAEYAFTHSYNAILISTPEMAQGETYTLTISGVDTAIEMTSTVYSNRGGSGEMGGMGGRGGR